MDWGGTWLLTKLYENTIRGPNLTAQSVTEQNCEGKALTFIERHKQVEGTSVEKRTKTRVRDARPSRTACNLTNFSADFENLHVLYGACGNVEVEALCYKPEGREFETR
jgi:hypothetical protein